MDEVWVSPGRQFGQVCAGGTRVPVEAVVDLVWLDGVDAAMDDFALTRRQVLNACWFAATFDLFHSEQPRRGPWRRRWGGWVAANGRALWESKGEPADPPCRDELPDAS